MRKKILYLLLITKILTFGIISFHYFSNEQVSVVHLAPNKVRRILPKKEIYVPKPTISLYAVGDIMLSREVANRIKKAKDDSYPFSLTSKILKEADITFGNLETTVFIGRKIGIEMVFRSNPSSLKGLLDAGFDLVSLANNHTYNFGEQGLLKTMHNLKTRNIPFCGAGVDYKMSHTPVLIQKKGIKFAFLCYNDTDVVSSSTFATTKKAGTSILDVGDLKRDISKIKNQVDYVVVSIHSGTEYARKPNQKQIKYAHAAIDAGAKLVLGHHPHVLQPVEHYKEGTIFYSLGNFIFDQIGTRQNQTVIAKIFFNTEEDKITYDFIPFQIIDWSKPSPIKDSKIKEQILSQLK